MTAFHLVIQKVCVCGRVIASKNITGDLATTLRENFRTSPVSPTLDVFEYAINARKYDRDMINNAVDVVGCRRDVCDLCVLVKP